MTALLHRLGPCLLLLSLLAACSGGDDGGEASPDTRAAPVSTTVAPPTTAAPLDFDPEPVTWEDCQATYQCATLSVPLDWTDPTGPTTDIDLARVPARRPGQHIGSLLVNPGGPGASGVGFAIGYEWSAGLRDRFDIVGWDPRGVGPGDRLQCGDAVPAWLQADPSPDDPQERRRLDATAMAVADECEAEDGDLLPNLGADNEARDLEAIRLALGEDALNYYGVSYGTLIGLRYAALFPTHIRAMTLDGVLDPTVSHEEFYLLQTTALEAGLEQLLADCEQDAACPVEDPRAAFDTVAADVEERRLPGGGGLGPAEFGRASFYATYDPALAAPYLRGLADALEGDGVGLAAMALEYDQGSPYVAYAGIWCVDLPHTETVEDWDAFVDEVVAVAPRIGAVSANEMRPCLHWPAEADRPTDEIVAPGADPILVVNTTGDAVTPIAGAEAVADTLESGHLLRVEGDGHGALGTPCADRVTARYFTDLEVPSDDC